MLQVGKHKLVGGILNGWNGGIVGPTLGPNLAAPANGPYSSGNWSATALTETTGQTDPFGGTAASLLTDTAISSQHVVQIAPTLNPNQKYLIQAYFKPGTYTGGIAISISTGNNTQAVGVTSAGAMGAMFGTITNMVVTSVGGFFFCSFNCLTGGTVANSAGVGFGVGGPPFLVYTGTVQNQTLYGVSIQTST